MNAAQTPGFARSSQPARAGHRPIVLLVDAAVAAGLTGTVGVMVGGMVAVRGRFTRTPVPSTAHLPGARRMPVDLGRAEARIFSPRTSTPVAVETPPGPDSALDPDTVALLGVLPGAAVVVAADDRVIFASPRARALGLLRRERLAFDELTACASAARSAGVARECELAVRRLPMRKGRLELRVRSAPLAAGNVALMIDDLTEERRVDAVRRDFIANVSHELKTPVGALSLLAEAVRSATDDPAAIQRFAARMQTEAVRLSNLVTDLIDLSRLQGDDPLSHAHRVEVDRVVAEAVDSTRQVAAAKEIELVVGGTPDLEVYGEESQLVTALRNLLTNAIAYSPPRTRVAVATLSTKGVVEMAVKDQGIGIPERELTRIFERFYRVDPARSRVTGGTGLGLAIVNHVCSNHGGDVTVWSVAGEGSTFTLRLPAYGPATVELTERELAEEETPEPVGHDNTDGSAIR